MRALKPDPDGWRVIAAHFGRALRDGPAVVGDSWVDGVAATAAGVPFVAYRANEADLARWKITPVAHLDDLATLPAWLVGNGRDVARSLRTRPRAPGTTSPSRARRGAGPAAPAPLADRMRPRTLDEVVGQEHLLGPGRVLRAAIESGELHSMILWGPPGSGKTHARLADGARGGRTLRRVLGRALRREGDPPGRRRGGEPSAARAARTILFVDEIHRFNRAQQDAFLPHVEKGTIVLIGATTENPSFEVNSALLSRCRVYVLRGLGEDDLLAIMRRALADGERGLAPPGAGRGRRRARVDRAPRQRRRPLGAQHPRAGRAAGAAGGRAPPGDRDDDPRGRAAARPCSTTSRARSTTT